MLKRAQIFDSVLVLSFGGPEGPDDVRPFLRNVVRGRAVPAERLEGVVGHYLHFGGKSPINQQGRDFTASLRAELAKRGVDLPVYFGNRNWHPMIEDTVSTMADDGCRHGLVFTTSAWGGYSGCRQYHEDIARAREAVGARSPHLTKLPQYWDHPLFLDIFGDEVRKARSTVPMGSRLVFTAHSIPVAADENSGPPGESSLYSRQVKAAAAAVADRVGEDNFDVVWQSRSGPPTVPWLEPDICDHLDAIAQAVPGVVLCPIGFVSDHLEVLWDLDTEACAQAERLNLPLARAATPIYDPRFCDLAVTLIRQQIETGEPSGSMGSSTDGAPCRVGCCPPVRR